jgi:hypothetical protein
MEVTPFNEVDFSTKVDLLNEMLKQIIQDASEIKKNKITSKNMVKLDYSLSSSMAELIAINYYYTSDEDKAKEQLSCTKKFLDGAVDMLITQIKEDKAMRH